MQHIRSRPIVLRWLAQNGGASRQRGFRIDEDVVILRCFLIVERVGRKV